MSSSMMIVESLYKGLAGGRTEEVAALLAADLEWWFHGPPQRQHMMRVLTGEKGDSFRFEPKKVMEVGKWIVAEGWEGEEAYWVHIWTVEGGIITEFREYFNTSVTVRELGRPAAQARSLGWTGRNRTAPTVWQSELREGFGPSMPGLVLAI